MPKQTETFQTMKSVLAQETYTLSPSLIKYFSINISFIFVYITRINIFYFCFKINNMRFALLGILAGLFALSAYAQDSANQPEVGNFFITQNRKTMLMKKSKRLKLLSNKLRLPQLKKHPLLIKNIIASNTKEESKHGVKTNLTSKENGRRKESLKQQKINLNKINNHGKNLKSQLKEKASKKLNKSNRKETGKENKVIRKLK